MGQLDAEQMQRIEAQRLLTRYADGYTWAPLTRPRILRHELRE